MLKRLLLATFLFEVFLSSVTCPQDCTVFSGQTVPFTLAAGAKAAWDPNPTGLRTFLRPEKKAIVLLVRSHAGRVNFILSGITGIANPKISVFAIDGRYLGSATMYTPAYGMFTSHLPPGIYLARCTADGTVLQTVRFVAGRQP